MRGDRLAFGIIMIAITVAVGMYANPKWKSYKEAANYGNGFIRAIIGFSSYIAIIGYMTSHDSWITVPLLVIITLLALVFFKLRKDGYHAVRMTVLLLFASMGTYARIIMAISLIGIPFNKLAADYATMADEEWEEYFKKIYK